MDPAFRIMWFSTTIHWLLFFSCWLLSLHIIRADLPISSSKDEMQHVSYSWSANFEISTNGSYEHSEEEPPVVQASGTHINGTLDLDDIFPLRTIRESSSSDELPRNRSRHLSLTSRLKNSATGRSKRESAKDRRELNEALGAAKRDHDRRKNEEELEENSQDEFEISPEMKVKIYTGVILGTIFLLVFVMCLWPLFKCCRTCCRIGQTGSLACWDCLHGRDPGYRVMQLAAKQAGLTPPTPEEYDAFMTGWEDKAPELMEALME